MDTKIKAQNITPMNTSLYKSSRIDVLASYFDPRLKIVLTLKILSILDFSLKKSVWSEASVHALLNFAEAAEVGFVAEDILSCITGLAHYSFD